MPAWLRFSASASSLWIDLPAYTHAYRTHLTDYSAIIEAGLFNFNEKSEMILFNLTVWIYYDWVLPNPFAAGSLNNLKYIHLYDSLTKKEIYVI